MAYITRQKERERGGGGKFIGYDCNQVMHNVNNVQNADRDSGMTGYDSITKRLEPEGVIRARL